MLNNIEKFRGTKISDPYILQVVFHLCQLHVGLIRDSPLTLPHFINCQLFFSFHRRLLYLYDVMLPCLAASNANSRKMTVNSNILYKILPKLTRSEMIVFNFQPFDFSLNGIDITFSMDAFTGICRIGAKVFDMSTIK